ncbi:hypothetical protein GGD63_007544 [Bradyrhizobium sp. cir1]|nr:hypothetical protein [Bradyrhizobium sp. cir1]MBB4374710.1 hypothetical protein [Bradyrhizobium sp. cir1]
MPINQAVCSKPARSHADFYAEMALKKVPLSLPFASLSSCFRFSV